MRKSLYIAVSLASLVAAAPAAARTIEVGGAAPAVRSVAEALGEVDQVNCWRLLTAVHTRDSHRAVCVAWWVHTPAGESCAVFYEVRLARGPSRRLTVAQTFDPWCAPAP